MLFGTHNGVGGEDDHLRSFGDEVIILQVMECLDTVHAGHHVIHEHDIVPVVLHELDTFGTRRSKVGFDTRELQEIAGNFKVHVVVVNDQYACLRSKEVLSGFRLCLGDLPESVGIVADEVIRKYLLDNRERELRTHTVDTVDMKFAVHHSEKLGDDRHSESRAFDVPVADLLDTLERFEELLHILGLDTDTGVFNRNKEFDFVAFSACVLHRESDASFVCILDRICEQVHDNL